MKRPVFPIRSVSASLILCGVVLVPLSIAQSPSGRDRDAATDRASLPDTTQPARGNQQARPSEVANIANGRGNAATRRRDFENAKAHARSRNFEELDRAVARRIPQRRDTPAWHRERSRQLIAVAEDLARDGDVDGGVLVARRSLNDFAEIARKSTDARAKARARLSAGRVHERFLGDAEAAITEYRAALEADPEDKAARESLEQLQDRYAKLQERIRRARQP